jgi:Domain of unknown function (DUF4417)
MVPIRDRIVAFRRTPAADLLPSPGNFRRHPAVQRQALAGLLASLGFAGAVLTYRDPHDPGGRRRVIDGHLRLDLMAGQEVPELETDLSPEEAELALATYDPVAALAETDAAALDALLGSLDLSFEEGLLARPDGLEALLAEVGAPPAFEEPGLEDRLTRLDVPDALFPTDNDWQVPLLDLQRQAEAVDLPVVTWGSVARTRRMRGTWHFYCDDYRYEALWDDPSPVVNSGCASAVEPNFSIYQQTPRAVALYRIYQKRWIGRWWQSEGVKLFVDLNVSGGFEDLNLLGVPEGWRSYATRGYADQLDATEAEYTRACQRAGSEDLLFLVYGGGKAVAERCGKRGWVHVGEHMDRVKEHGRQG